ncbi:Hypothetical predicted protein [Paramuricea clavata]|uniref:Uncharacterized protein n=1 Tax=Paramuricea clavata TaxID=317549 RepID=A0A6S7JBJ4_PARCT|nr:Hypothetical predicted protein [Paramuricea clavata]
MRKILLVFNTLKTSWPPDLRKLFVFVRDSHPIPTRSSITDLKVPSVKTTQAKSKISFSGASLFNSLPSELKDIENHSIYSYKKKLKTYFIQLNYEVDHVNKFSCIDFEGGDDETVMDEDQTVEELDEAKTSNFREENKNDTYRRRKEQTNKLYLTGKRTLIKRLSAKTNVSVSNEPTSSI